MTCTSILVRCTTLVKSTEQTTAASGLARQQKNCLPVQDFFMPTLSVDYSSLSMYLMYA